MKIVNSIMPMSDIEALAANGQKLRVAVTKTSAQGKSVQSTTPNLMSFSTDENSIWFNGKKYGVYILKGFENLSTDSHTSVIQSFLRDFTYDRWVDAVNTGNIVFVETNNILIPASVYANSSEDLNIMFVTLTYTYFVSIHYSTGSGYSIDIIQQDSLVKVADVNNTLTNSSTDKPLSAAMGKKLNDEKLAKTDVVNNLTTTDTSKALSAAQGKALNDKISGLGSVYRVKGTKTNLSDVLALTDAKVGDVWNVTNAFTLGGKPYPANTNVVCITATSSSDHDEGNWDPLGGTVNLSTYVLKSDVVDNTVSSDTNKPLSANQGRLLGARLDELEVKVGLYKLLKPFTSGSLGSKAEVDSLLGAYSTFSSAVTTGKLIYGIYNDSNSLTHTVTFTAYNTTGKKQIIMYAVINPTTMVRISADYEGTNWVTATIEQGAIGEGTIIE